MKWIGKVVGGLLGALALGPIGAALGVLLGHQFDEERSAAAPLALPAKSSARSASGSSAPPSASWATSPRPTAASPSRRSPRRAPSWTELRLDSSCRCGRRSTCYTDGKSPGFDFTAEVTALARACQGRPDLIARVSRDPGARRAGRQQPRRPGAAAASAAIARVLGISDLEYAHIEAVLASSAAASAPAAPAWPRTPQQQPGRGLQGAGSRSDRGQRR